MRRPDPTTTNGTTKKKSALESLIPATSTRGRKRPRPGESLTGTKSDASALKMLNAFRARLEKADHEPPTANGTTSHALEKGKGKGKANGSIHPPPNADDEEASLCDLHFIANCQSCAKAEAPSSDNEMDPDDNTSDFLSHSLNFAKDRLGKDLSWRENMRNLSEEDMRELGVVDVRAKEREIGEKGRWKTDRGKGKGKERLR
jgi:peptidyl-prolyl cis-trans isomerase SDCCAG10